MKKSLLGELAERFVTQKENLASEALNIILNKSKEANQAVCNEIAKLDDRIEKKLKFTTQVHSSKDSAIFSSYVSILCSLSTNWSNIYKSFLFITISFMNLRSNCFTSILL